MNDEEDFIDLAAAECRLQGPFELSIHQELGPFTYFIQSGDTIKIGCSKNPEKRVDQLRRGGKAERPSAGMATEPRLLAYGLGGWAREEELHVRFKASQDQGEWFYITDELVALVEDTIQRQARLEVALHEGRYQHAVKNHHWPAATFDTDWLVEKRVEAIKTDKSWMEVTQKEFAA